MRALALLALSALLVMCTPAKPSTSPPSPPVVAIDAGSGPTSPADRCDAARQHMVELSCPPEEDAFGGWVAECSGWSHASVITDCIELKKNCLGTRQCLGESQ